MAILEGSNLLAVGITKVMGQFNAGDVVGLVDQNGEEFAKGNPNYTNNEINMIRGLQASEIKKKLGSARPKEVIGRKKIHLLSGSNEN